MFLLIDPGGSPWGHSPETDLESDDTPGCLDIRRGRILRAEAEPTAPKAAYRLTIDFGKSSVKTSVGRFTQQTPEHLAGQQVVGILSLPPRLVGDVPSEVLVLGVQVPGADSGEAAALTPLMPAKLGSEVL